MNRTYEIVTLQGRLRMEIPEDWKVTYAPVQPGNRGSNVLRVYESDTKQRAIFDDVVSFRDLSIPVYRLQVKEEGKEEWSNDDSSRKFSRSTKVERRWVREEAIEPVEESAA